MRRKRQRTAFVAIVALVSVLLHGESSNGPIAEIPIEFEKNLPLASIQVNGSPLTVVLDSGAEDFVLDDEAARRIGVKADQEGLSSGSGGMFAVKLARGVRLGLGGLEIDVDRTVVTNLRGIKLTRSVEGVLGRPLFGSYIVEMDYPAARVRLYGEAGYLPPASGYSTRLWMTHGPTLKGRLTLPGQAPLEADFQVDTGSSHVLTLCKPFVDKHRMLASLKNLKAARTLGLGGTSPDMVGQIDRVMVGPYSVEKPEVRFSTHAFGSFATDRFSGNLGNGFLNRFAVIFDLPHSRLILMQTSPRSSASRLGWTPGPGHQPAYGPRGDAGRGGTTGDTRF